MGQAYCILLKTERVKEFAQKNWFTVGTFYSGYGLEIIMNRNTARIIQVPL